MNQPFQDATVYHIYPLGHLGAPEHNDFSSPATPRLKELHDWLPHLNDLGVNALYLGPLFESSAHGYDTVDYFHVDRRLGNNEMLRDLANHLRESGIRLVLDGGVQPRRARLLGVQRCVREGRNPPPTKAGFTSSSARQVPSETPLPTKAGAVTTTS